MTTQKIIDNIQTRLENLISERFTGTYQNIDITCSNYNPSIDSNITITITVTDQNDDPVTGFTVPLKIDGTSISGITTNSSGVATHTYNCTDWGNHKISVKSVSAFINVTGWRTYSTSSSYSVKYNDEYVYIGLSYPSNATLNRTYDIVTLPTGYRPDINVSAPTTTSTNNGIPYAYLKVLVDGKVQLILRQSTYSTGGTTLYGGIMYPIRK